MLQRVPVLATARLGLRALSSAGIPGLMQRSDLLVSSILEFANGTHPEVEVVTRTVEGPILR